MKSGTQAKRLLRRRQVKDHHETIRAYRVLTDDMANAQSWDIMSEYIVAERDERATMLSFLGRTRPNYTDQP